MFKKHDVITIMHPKRGTRTPAIIEKLTQTKAEVVFADKHGKLFSFKTRSGDEPTGLLRRLIAQPYANEPLHKPLQDHIDL